MSKQQYEQLDTQFEQGGEAQSVDQGTQEPVTRNEQLCQRALEFSLGIKNFVYAKENPLDGTYSIDFILDKDKIKSIYKTFYKGKTVNLFAPEQSVSIGKIRTRTGRKDVVPREFYEQEAINLLRLNLPLEGLDPSGNSSIKNLQINDNGAILGSTSYIPILGAEPTSSILQDIKCDPDGCYCTFYPDGEIVYISIPPPSI